MDEIWTENLYKRFKWCRNILDLWGYLWESAIYFNQKIWAKVDIYEPDKRNFAILSKNCHNHHGIKYIEWAVVASEKKFKIVYDNIDWWSISEHEWEDIKTYNFFDIIEKKKYDGLKIDIEWWEYEILDSLLLKKIIPLRNIIFLEFHDLSNKKNIIKIIGYIWYFINHWYVFELFDNNNKPIQSIFLIWYSNNYINIILKKI